MKIDIITIAIILFTCVGARPRTPQTTGFSLTDKQAITDNVLEKSLISHPNAPEQIIKSKKPQTARSYLTKSHVIRSHQLKSKQATVLLSSMQKLRRIKHNRNRRVRLNILAAQRNLQNRRYLQMKPGKRTRKQVPDLTLRLVNGNGNINNQRDKENKQKFYKRVLCERSGRHKFCREFYREQNK